jgi:3D (Asp-Asp-Asp) domain-containing protein
LNHGGISGTSRKGPTPMKRVSCLIVLVLWLAGLGLADDSSAKIGRELGDMFNTAGATLEAPAKKAADETTLRGGTPSGGRELSVSAYAYCLRGRTASGRYTKHGIIAVDPRVIPLGSRLYVPGYGWGVAADTGGLIVGNKIDVWRPTTADCYRWGVRRVKVKVFPPAK